MSDWKENKLVGIIAAVIFALAILVVIILQSKNQVKVSKDQEYQNNLLLKQELEQRLAEPGPTGK